MASIRRKERSPYYFACFYDTNGDSKCRSTKSKNKKDAQRIADEWEAAWQDKITTHQAKKVLNNILELVGSPQIPAKTLNQVFDDWLAEKKREVSVGTYDQYLSVLKNARTHLGAAADKEIVDLNRFVLIEARDSVADAISPSAANKMIDHLRMVFRYALENELIDRSPMMKVKPVAITASSSARRASSPESD